MYNKNSFTGVFIVESANRFIALSTTRCVLFDILISMTKAAVDTLITNMKRANIVTKATAWLYEGYGEKQMNVRYVGITLDEEWQEIMSVKNNLLLKFIIDRETARLEFYLANKPPFVRLFTKHFTATDKWEILLGDLRRRLRKDKTEFQNHTESIGNLYTLIKPHLLS